MPKYAKVVKECSRCGLVREHHQRMKRGALSTYPYCGQCRSKVNTDYRASRPGAGSRKRKRPRAMTRDAQLARRRAHNQRRRLDPGWILWQKWLGWNRRASRSPEQISQDAARVRLQNQRRYWAEVSTPEGREANLARRRASAQTEKALFRDSQGLSPHDGQGATIYCLGGEALINGSWVPVYKVGRTGGALQVRVRGHQGYYRDTVRGLTVLRSFSGRVSDERILLEKLRGSGCPLAMGREWFHQNPEVLLIFHAVAKENPA